MAKEIEETVTVTMVLLPETQEKLYKIEEGLMTESVADAVSAAIDLTYSIICDISKGWTLQLVKDGEIKEPLNNDGNFDIDVELIDDSNLN